MPNPALISTGLDIAKGVVNTGMGLILQRGQDKRQLKQQRKLQELQIKGQKELADYSYEQQMKMWEATNYEAQKAQMKKAGLNPGLMYGMGGGGGQTVGTAPSTNVSGGTAAGHSGEIQSMLAMGLTRELQKAQIENIKAQTANVNADTANKPLEGKNIQQETALKGVQTELAKIEQEIKGRSTEATIRHIDAAAERVMHEAIIARNQANISEETWKTEVQKAYAELIGIGINNTLHEQQTAESKQRITNMAQDLLNGIRGLDQKDTELQIRKFEANLKQEMPGIGQATGRIVNNMINEYLELTNRILGNKEAQKPIK